MAFEQDITELVKSTDRLTDIVDNKVSEIDSRVNSAEAQFQQWLNTRHVGFALTDTFIDHSDSYISIPPRFSTLEEAEAFSFSAAEDYSPVDSNDETIKHYADIISKVPASAHTWSSPQASQFTGRHSVYASIGVGTNPHPNPLPVNRISMLMNRVGAYHAWIATGVPTPNYAEPRAFFNYTPNLNREIRGQSYGVTNYNDLMSFHENEPHHFSAGFSSIRIINLGPHPIQIKGFWLIHHGHQKES